jgi:polysaccharide export outer membrane protein
LAPGDAVELRVYQEEDLSLPKALITKDGNIHHFLLGDIPVAGKTADEAKELIHELLAKDYLVNPKVSLVIVEYAARRFTVLGHVMRPGTYNYPSNESLDLIQAVSMAGGLTRLGSPSKITLTRMEGGEKKTHKLDLEAFRRDRNAQPFVIQPGDVIEVGEKFF